MKENEETYRNTSRWYVRTYRRKGRGAGGIEIFAAESTGSSFRVRHRQIYIVGSPWRKCMAIRPGAPSADNILDFIVRETL